MKLLPAYIVVSNFTAVLLSATIDRYRDLIAVDAIQKDSPGQDITPISAVTCQTGPSCAESLSSESCVPSVNSTDIGVEIKKGGHGHGHGKGWKHGGGRHHSGTSRIDSHSMVLVLATCCSCAIVASLI
ncbi:hypothetical protein F4860DRAFT_382308 [Xylaria cubensis]|nr:hypothetical protein F4860DRAFT_382308 [Xylaria cubensis]